MGGRSSRPKPQPIDTSVFTDPNKSTFDIIRPKKFKYNQLCITDNNYQYYITCPAIYLDKLLSGKEEKSEEKSEE